MEAVEHIKRNDQIIDISNKKNIGHIDDEIQYVVMNHEKQNFNMEEAYKTLRANLEFSGEDIHVIAITSCIPFEGKSSVALNLAMSIAETGKKTILVDADLRKSVLIGKSKTGKVSYGLTHCLSGRKSIDDVICETSIKNLNIIFSGPFPPNPSELLGGKNFKNMIIKLRDMYDYIIVDTPPLGSVIDGAIISKNCDGAVIVIESNKVSYRFAQKIIEQLEKAECKILGCVLNKVELKGKGYYGKYYGKYYGNYDENK